MSRKLTIPALMISFCAMLLAVQAAMYAQVAMAPPKPTRFVEETLADTPQSPRSPEVEALIRQIDTYEAPLVAGTAAHVRLVQVDPEQTVYEGEWARRGARGMYNVRQNLVFEDKTRSYYMDHVVYDGVVARRLSVYPKVEGSNVRQFRDGETSGTVSSTPAALEGHSGPARLLGHDLKSGMYTLAELLREAREVTLRPAPEDIDAHACRVLDFDMLGTAIGRDGEVPTVNWASIWIDAERDCRPLRIERYVDNGGRQLSYVIDRIQLERTDGVWLPVSGVITHYRLSITPEEGYTIEQLQAMPQDEAVKHVRREVVPDKTQPISISASSWRLGDAVSDRLFVLDFPKGAIVWDEFRQKRYTVGAPDEDEPVNASNLPQGEMLITVPERLCMFLDDGRPLSANVYLFTRLVDPELKVISAACDLEGVTAQVEKPDEGGVRRVISVTAAPLGRPGRRYGRLRLTADPDDFGEILVPIMVREPAVK